MEETKRSQKRSHLTFYYDVCDVATEKVIGKLADITTEGLLLLSTDEIEPDVSYDLKIVADLDQPIAFSSKCRWCRIDINPDYYDIGFHVESISPDDKQRIRDLIDKSYFKD